MDGLSNITGGVDSWRAFLCDGCQWVVCYEAAGAKYASFHTNVGRQAWCILRGAPSVLFVGMWKVTNLLVREWMQRSNK
eukprot:scaffold269817_cov14-Tisochrysis_lutea.AAC.1